MSGGLCSNCSATLSSGIVIGSCTTCVRCDAEENLLRCTLCCDGVCNGCNSFHGDCDCVNDDESTPEDLAYLEVNFLRLIRPTNNDNKKKRERGPHSVYIIDDNKCQVLKYPGWLPEGERKTLFSRLTKHVLPLMDHDRGVFMGKPWVSKRLVGTVSVRPGVSYSYSTVQRKSMSITFADLPWLEDLRVRMEALCGHSLNFVFINWYRPYSDDKLGYHSDDEADMIKGASIVSLSVGDTRHFAFRKKGETKMLHQTPLEDGDVAVMRGETQSHYQHAITEKGAKKSTRGRWNLTFRQFCNVE